MTIEKIESEIRIGKCTMIWHSTKSLWWTHSPIDVKEASEVGWVIARERYEQLLLDPKAPDIHKRRVEQFIKLAVSSGRSPLPLDPTGAPLKQIVAPQLWLEYAWAKSAGFGAHGIQALMKAHHQNCNGHYYDKWLNYNLLLG